jgi:hypothetical protein
MAPERTRDAELSHELEQDAKDDFAHDLKENLNNDLDGFGLSIKRVSRTAHSLQDRPANVSWIDLRSNRPSPSVSHVRPNTARGPRARKPRPIHTFHPRLERLGHDDPNYSDLRSAPRGTGSMPRAPSSPMDQIIRVSDRHAALDSPHRFITQTAVIDRILTHLRTRAAHAARHTGPRWVRLRSLTEVSAALKAPERDRRHAAARHEALARSAIARYA